MCQKAVPRFFVSIKETFPNSIFVEAINEYDQGSVTKISKVLGHVYHFAGQRVL